MNTPSTLSGSTRRARMRSALVMGGALTLALSLSACGGSSDASDTSDASQSDTASVADAPKDAKGICAWLADETPGLEAALKGLGQDATSVTVADPAEVDPFKGTTGQVGCKIGGLSVVAYDFTSSAAAKEFDKLSNEFLSSMEELGAMADPPTAKTATSDFDGFKGRSLVAIDGDQALLITSAGRGERRARVSLEGIPKAEAGLKADDPNQQLIRTVIERVSAIDLPDPAAG